MPIDPDLSKKYWTAYIIVIKSYQHIIKTGRKLRRTQESINNKILPYTHLVPPTFDTRPNFKIQPVKYPFLKLSKRTPVLTEDMWCAAVLLNIVILRLSMEGSSTHILAAELCSTAYDTLLDEIKQPHLVTASLIVLQHLGKIQGK